MLAINSAKFILQIFADVVERLLDVQPSMESGQAWFSEGLTNVSFRPAGDEEEDWKAFLAKRTPNYVQDLLLNIFSITFIQTIDNDGQWPAKRGLPTWIDDEPLKLVGQRPFDNGRITLDCLRDEML
jgi:hypothetical protein